MEKRAFLAVILSLAVFLLFSWLFPQPHPKGPAQQARMSSAAAPAAVAAAAAPAAALPAAAAAAKQVRIETPLYTAVFTTRGAALKSFVLKKYTEDAGGKGGPVVIVDEAAPENATLRLEGTTFGIDPLAVYGTEAGDLTIAKGEKKSVSFVWRSAAGVTVTRTYTFSGDTYAINLDDSFGNGGVAPLSGPVTTVLTHRVPAGAPTGRLDINGPVAFVDGKLHSSTAKDLASKEVAYPSAVQWGGFADKYFLSAAVGLNADLTSAVYRSGASGAMEGRLSSSAVTVAPGASVSLPYLLYLGPKDLDILKSVDHNLEQAIDLGWFSAIAKPLLHTLKFFYRYVGNYGIAIIIITVILKFLFFPLTYKSYKSMKEMQKLQPKMAKIREKYKNDRDAMNREIMKMYQEHKVNPFGGCLPMVVQIPVFFALYKSLMFSIELRHAPFFLWITDLAAKDPYYVTPIIMGVTMFIQQKMTPSNMDPAQAKMMLMLPVIFTFMFLSFPSGLVLYWLTNNILTIAQQAYINGKLKEA